MLFVGLDLSIKTGIALLRNVGGAPKFVCTAVTPASKEGTTLCRAAKLTEGINNVLSEYRKPSEKMVIAIEGYGFARHANIRITFEIGTLVRYAFMLAGQSYYEVSPSSLKKYVAGKGNLKKEMMLKEVYKRWGIDCLTNDEADAVGLAMMAYNTKHKVKMPVVNASAMDKMGDWLVH